MFRLSLAISCALYGVFVVILVKKCAFLRPLIGMIWQDYQEPALIFSALFLLNCVVAVYQVLRRLTLADTGDKLAYVEKQLRGRASISQELTERILEEQ